MQRPDVERQLFVDLTPAEQRVKGAELAALCNQRDDLSDEAKAVAADFKMKIDALTRRAKVLATEVESKRELRPVRCRWSVDELHETWSLYRADTGEILATEPVTQADRQTELSLS